MSTVINVDRGTTIPGYILTAVSDISTYDPADAGTLFSAEATYQTSSNSFQNVLSQVAQAIWIFKAAADSPQPNATFQNAFNYIYNQMIANGNTVQRNSVGVSTASNGGNVGNPVIVTSVKNNFGLPVEYQFAETISGVCIGDSQSNTAVALQEPIQFQGVAAASPTTSWLYPAGSGATFNLTCVNALQASSANGNFLSNGSFETFLTVPNVPDNWHVLTGTPGTQILKTTSTVYDGSSALQFVGDSTTQTAIYQQFGTDTPTSTTLKPLTQYAANCWVKVDVAPAAGVLELALTDGSNTITEDYQAVNNTGTVSLVSVGTTYVPFSVVFRTPKVIPLTGLRLRLRLSTALSTGSNVFIDRLAFSVMNGAGQNGIYQGGFSAVAFSGNTAQIKGDSYTITSTNSRNGLIQSGCDILLPMRQNNFMLPSLASGASISDALVS